MLQLARKIGKAWSILWCNYYIIQRFLPWFVVSNVALNPAPDSLVVVLVGRFLDTSGLGFASYANVIAWTSGWRWWTMAEIVVERNDNIIKSTRPSQFSHVMLTAGCMHAYFQLLCSITRDTASCVLWSYLFHWPPITDGHTIIILYYTSRWARFARPPPLLYIIRISSATYCLRT